MSTIRRLWMSVLAAALVGSLSAMVLSGLLGAGQKAEAVVEPRVTVTRTITIPAEAFKPTSDDLDFTDLFGQLTLNSGSGSFVAPLFFEAPEVTIRKITLFPWDNGGSDISLLLYRGIPAGPDYLLGGVQSSGGQCLAANLHREGLHLPEDHRRPRPLPVALLPGTSSDSYGFYGARITYTYDTGV